MAVYQNFIGPSNMDPSLVADSERTINWYAEFDKQRGKAALLRTPGFTPWVTLPKSPVWALWADPQYGELFALAGPLNGVHLYSITAISGTWTPADLGAVPNYGNSTYFTGWNPFLVGNSNAKQLLCAGGHVEGGLWSYLIGSTGWTTLDASLSNRGGWPYLVSCGCAIDGYFIVNAYATGWSNKFFISALNDGTQWSALDFSLADDAPNAIIGMGTLRRELWLFGTKRIVIYYDSGAANFPFSRIPGAVIEVSCAAPSSICEAEGSFIFVGGAMTGDVEAGDAGLTINSGGSASPGTTVYITNGYTAQRISTHAIEKAIAAWGAANISGAVAFAYQDKGHTFYVLNPGSTGQGNALVYDLTTGLWHERVSNLGTANNYNAQCYLHYNGLHLVGDNASGNIYKMDTATGTDNGSAITRTRIGPPIKGELVNNFFHEFTLDFDGGSAFTLSWSNDGGNTFIDSTALSGVSFARAVWRRLGKARDRRFQLVTSDSAANALLDAYIVATPGVA